MYACNHLLPKLWQVQPCPDCSWKRSAYHSLGSGPFCQSPDWQSEKQIQVTPTESHWMVEKPHFRFKIGFNWHTYLVTRRKCQKKQDRLTRELEEKWHPLGGQVGGCIWLLGKQAAACVTPKYKSLTLYGTSFQTFNVLQQVKNTTLHNLFNMLSTNASI